MHTLLHLLPASRRGARRLLGSAALGLALLGAASSAQAQTVYGLTGTPTTPLLISFNASAPALPTPLAITNITAGQALVGLDSRPATGQLFGLGYNAATNDAQIYVINPTTGVATAVNATPITLLLGGPTERVSFDFNPTVDRIRVVSSNDKNYRLNPITGGVTALDTDINLPSMANPAVGAVAYTNSFIGAATTTLYDIDESTSTLYIQNPPNNGTLTLPVSITNASVALLTAADQADFDIYTDPGTRAETKFLSVARPTGTAFYTLNSTTGDASLVATFAGAQVTDVAFAIDRTAPALTGQLAYGLTTAGNLISFDTGNPGFIRSLVAISGLAAGQTLAGTDFRPNTGELFGLGYNPTTGVANDRLYTINTGTGVATAVGMADFDLDLGTDATLIGFDFNPTVDRIRVEGGTNDKNYRLNPVTGGIVLADGDLVYGPGDAGTGQNPTVGTVAYTNSFIGSTSTGLYTLDHALGLVSLQTPPNNGTLTNSRNLRGVNGVGVGGAINAVNDLDVYFRTSTSANVPYLAASPVGTTTTSLYTLDALGMVVGTQTATLVGTIGLGSAVRDISVMPDAAAVAPAMLAALTGQLAYAVAGGNLVSFDTGNPGVIRSAVNITGLPSATGVAQVLVGADFRPLTGELFVLGYNASNQTGQLYTLNLTSGALAAVGGLESYPLGATAANVGFDFNPTVDRIRVVSATNQANLRVNPATGLIINDTALNNVAGTPAISAVAYTNNDNNAASGTTLYAYDQTRNLLLRSTNANGGVYVDQGASGLSVNAAGVDFDIFTDNTSGANSAFAVAAPAATTADNLYTVNVATGAFASQGRIGNGSNLTALAVFLTPGAAANVLTWTGLTSTDYGTASNWNPQAVPTAISNVLIPSGPANQPSVSNAQTALNVTIDAGASLVTITGGTLSVSGNIANAGSLDGSGTGTVALAGTVAQTISGAGNTRFRNLLIGNAVGVSTAGPVAVQSALTLNGPLAIGSGQAFTLLSDAAGTAFVVQGTGGSVTGQATVQRFIASTNTGLGYRHYAAPVTGSTVADLTTTGFTPNVTQGNDYNTSATPGTTTTFPNVFFYNQNRVGTVTNNFADFDKGWQAPTALADPLLVGRGYTVNIAGTAKVDFTGTLNAGTFPLTGLARGTNSESGWHLLGNPYPSAINWNLVRGSSLSNVADALYVFRSNGQYSGTYAAYVNGIGTGGGSNVVPLGQAFFVRATSTATPGTVTFEDNQRLASATDNNTAFQRTAADVRPMLTLSLNSATASQQTAIYFEAGATAADDSRYDASALPSTNGLTFSTEAGSAALAINGLPALTGNTVTVPLRLSAAQAGTYTLATDELRNLPAGYHAYLRDALTGQHTDLASTPRVALNLSANAPAGGRYAVVFSAQALLNTAPAALAALVSVYPNPARGTATLLLPNALRGTAPVAVQVLDNLGRVVLARTLAAETLELPLTKLAPGIYTVQARTAAGLVSKKLVVE